MPYARRIVRRTPAYRRSTRRVTFRRRAVPMRRQVRVRRVTRRRR